MAPPLVGVAVKVTLVPVHVLVLLALILTEGVTLGVTVTVTELLEAVVGEVQLAFEVNTQLTASLFANVELLYEAEFVPTLLPFSFH